MSEELKPCPFCGSPAMADSGFAPAESIICAFCSNNDCRLHSVDVGLSPEEWNQRALPDAFQIARHSRRLVEQQRERIAALEAKNAALAGANDNLKITINGLVDERDALAAELAAIKWQEPVAIANKGECAFWVSWTDAGKPLRGPGIKLYTLPAAPEGGGEV